MLNPFPELLYLSPFFAPLILRVTIGLLFLYSGYIQWQRRDSISKMRFPVVGGGIWVSWLLITFHALFGFLLIVGLYTQVAALFGILGGIKGLILKHRYPELIPIPRSAILLSLAMLVSILLTGAGAFAFDIPL
jgi:uncharacterized membrane protein YphA (DoxX/SURF4 family)